MDKSEAINAVVREWQSNKALCDLAATGIMAKVAKEHTISRPEVCKNHALIGPVIEHMGSLVARMLLTVRACVIFFLWVLLQ